MKENEELPSATEQCGNPLGEKKKIFVGEEGGILIIVKAQNISEQKT